MQDHQVDDTSGKPQVLCTQDSLSVQESIQATLDLGGPSNKSVRDYQAEECNVGDAIRDEHVVVVCIESENAIRDELEVGDGNM